MGRMLRGLHRRGLLDPDRTRIKCTSAEAAISCALAPKLHRTRSQEHDTKKGYPRSEAKEAEDGRWGPKNWAWGASGDGIRRRDEKKGSAKYLRGALEEMGDGEGPAGRARKEKTHNTNSRNENEKQNFHHPPGPISFHMWILTSFLASFFK